jgi:hypothetical protein
MKISFVGDISLQGLDQDKINLDQNVKNIFLNSDLTIGNLENPITTSDLKTDKTFVQLRTEGTSIKLLKKFNLLSLCNNHMFDYGIEGYTDTINFLDRNNILHFGAGLNKCNAQEPLKVEINAKNKVAFISGTRWNNATISNYGTAPYNGYKNIIKKLKQDNFFVIYYPHWGYEYIKTPPPDVRRHAHAMIDNGVDLIVGSHPHVLQGFEIYKQKYIFFSLGNFIFKNSIIENTASKENYSKCRTSAILQISINDDKTYDYKITPTSFNDDEIYTLNNQDSKTVTEYLSGISNILSQPYLKYLKKYYAQVPKLFENERRIYTNYPRKSKLSFREKLKKITLQGLLNRLAFYFLIKTKRNKCI